MFGVATNWFLPGERLLVSGVPFVYIISISMRNVKWILAKRGIRSIQACAKTKLAQF